MPDHAPIFESGGQVYFNFIRPHDDSLRQKLHVKRLIAQRQEWLEQFERSEFAAQLPPEVYQATIDDIKTRIAFWQSTLDQGQEEIWR